MAKIIEAMEAEAPAWTVRALRELRAGRVHKAQVRARLDLAQLLDAKDEATSPQKDAQP